MTVDLSALPTDAAEFVAGAVAAGKYHSADEVVLAGLRLLEDEERIAIELRAKIDEGIADLDRGDFISIDDAASHKILFDTLKSKQ